MVYFLKGRLPWQGIKTKDIDELYELILQKKLKTSLEELCEGIHENFKRFLIYCKDLNFEDEPKYEILIKYMNEILENKVIEYEWNESTWIDHNYTNQIIQIKKSNSNITDQKISRSSQISKNDVKSDKSKGKGSQIDKNSIEEEKKKKSGKNESIEKRKSDGIGGKGKQANNSASDLKLVKEESDNNNLGENREEKRSKSMKLKKDKKEALKPANTDADKNVSKDDSDATKETSICCVV